MSRTYPRRAPTVGVSRSASNRPEKKNAITRAMYAALGRRARPRPPPTSHPRARLSSASPGAFSAGNDIADFLAVADVGPARIEAVFDFLERIIHGEKADRCRRRRPRHRHRHDHADALRPCRRLRQRRCSGRRSSISALVPEAGSSLIAPAPDGPPPRLRAAGDGRALSPRQAMDAGFVNRIVAAGELEETALAAAKAIAAKPPEALAAEPRAHPRRPRRCPGAHARGSKTLAGALDFRRGQAGFPGLHGQGPEEGLVTTSFRSGVERTAGDRKVVAVDEYDGLGTAVDAHHQKRDLPCPGDLLCPRIADTVGARTV